MPGSPWRARLAALAATTAILVAACGGAATPTPAPPRRAAATPRPSRQRGAPYEGLSYPRPARPRCDCAAKTYNGTARTPATSRRSRRSTPRPSSSRSATPTSPSCRRSRSARSPSTTRPTSRRPPPDGSIVRPAERHRPVQAQGVGPGRPHHPRGQLDLLGRRRRRSRRSSFRWSTEAAQRLVELQSGNVDGIDNPGPTDIADDQGRREPEALPARRPERLLPRHEQHVRARSTTRRSARRSPWASTASGSSTTSPARLRASPTHFTPCSIPNGCTGAELVRLRPGRGQGAPGRGRLPRRLQDHDPPPRRRPRLPAPSRSSWPRRSRPSSRPT